MRLFDFSRAPNPRRVRIFIAEKGITIPTEQVDIGKGATREPEFLAMNPLGRVPVLELDDGSYIAESLAICRYLECIHPEPALFGFTPGETAHVEMWLHRVEYNLAQNVFGCFQNTHEYMKDRMTQYPEYGEECRKRALDFCALMNEQLGGGQYLAGDNYSMADISAQMALDFGKVVKIRPSEDHTHLRRWQDDVAARPSAKA